MNWIWLFLIGLVWSRNCTVTEHHFQEVLYLTRCHCQTTSSLSNAYQTQTCQSCYQTYHEAVIVSQCETEQIQAVWDFKSPDKKLVRDQVLEIWPLHKPHQG